MARFGTASARRKPSNLLPIILAMAIILLIGGAWYIYSIGKQQEIDPNSLCLLHSEPPTAALFMVDVTDRLGQSDVDMIVSDISDRIKSLKRASRVIVLTFGDDTATAFAPNVNKCRAPSGDEHRFDENGKFLDDDYRAVELALKADIKAALRVGESATSPITEQISRAASSPALHWAGRSRELIIYTNGLQTDALTGSKFRLPKVDGRVLEGVAATFVEIGNKRRHRLQTRELREAWRAWLLGSGAENVQIVAPGYTSSK